MKLSWRTELPHWIVFAAMAAVAMAVWNTLPERVPIHFDLQGRPNGWGGRFEALGLMPLVAIGVYLLLLFLPRIDPGRANYAAVSGAYSAIRLCVTVVLAVVYGLMIQSARVGTITPGRWLPLLIGGLLIVLGNQMGKLRPNWFVGVRTPWTLSSKLSWGKTHRLAGRLMVLAGIVWWILAALVPGEALWVGLVCMAAGMLTAIVYSYAVWRGDPDKTPPAGTLPAEEPRA
jgi:uncharacterized membrane protein